VPRGRKKSMTSVDVAAMVRELQSLVNSRLDKAYQLDHSHFLLRLNLPGAGKAGLHVQLGRCVYLKEEHETAERQPGPFVMLIRKHVSNARLTKIEQYRFDRVLILTFEKGETYKLVVELFRDGNIVLVRDGVIVQPLRSQSWSHRKVRAGEVYVPPPERPDPWGMDLPAFRHHLENSDKDLVRTLATGLGLGGQYAEEICIAAEVDKEKPCASVGEQEMARLFTAWNGVRQRVEDQPFPAMILDNGQPIDAVPIELAQYYGKELVRKLSFSQALMDYFAVIRDELEEEESDFDEELRRLERQAEQQRQTMASLEVKMAENRAKGEAIYANFQGCQAILDIVTEGRKTGDWKAVQARLKDVPQVVEVRPDEGSVTLSLSVEGEARNVKLDVRLDVNENAQAYYQKGSEAKAKIAGAEQALAKTNRLLEKEASRPRPKKEDRIAPTKEFWFERLRWFISSSGKLVLGGKDRVSNDRVVKKHMKLGDRYAHAEVQGAASVVVKGPDVDPASLEEACAFALIHSKAWNQKVGSGSAYWVLTDQVSKTPRAGEYVPKGAFIIRGKRNYVHNIPVRAAIGEVWYEGHRKIMCGPPSALAAQSQSYLIIEPGEIDKNAFAREWAKKFKVPQEEVLRVLPAGNVRVVEKVGVE